MSRRRSQPGSPPPHAGSPAAASQVSRETSRETPETSRIGIAVEPPAATPVSWPPPTAQVMKWILTGQSDADIAAAIAHYWPGLQAEQLAGDVAAELSRAGRPDPDLIRGFAIEATRDILRRAIDTGDLQVALRAVKNILDFSATFAPPEGGEDGDDGP